MTGIVGFAQAVGIAGRTLRDPAARHRVLEMRRASAGARPIWARSASSPPLPR